MCAYLVAATPERTVLTETTSVHSKADCNEMCSSFGRCCQFFDQWSAKHDLAHVLIQDIALLYRLLDLIGHQQYSSIADRDGKFTGSTACFSSNRLY